MLKKAMIVATLVALLVAGGGVSLASDHTPTVAILRFGPLTSSVLLQDTLLNAFQGRGLVSTEEAAAFRESGRGVDGAHIRLVAGDANMDFANISAIVEAALDEGADALITLSTPVTLGALHATLDMDDPPVVLFGSVYNPYASGIAAASCIKPSHVTGVEAVTNYEDIVPLLLLQDPDIQTVGTLFSASETSGQVGAEQIAQVGAELGLEVLTASVVGIADLIPAAESLVEKGAEAFLIPADMITVAGLPALSQVASENRMPIFHSLASSEYDGATVSAGSANMSLQAGLLALLLAGHLDGAVDIGQVGISSLSDLSVRVNMDAAEMHGVEISDRLLAVADGVLEDGAFSANFVARFLSGLGLDPESEAAKQFIAAMATVRSGGSLADLEDIPPEVSAIIARALEAQDIEAQMQAAMAAVRCTPEIIAEQQAALDAGE